MDKNQVEREESGAPSVCGPGFGEASNSMQDAGLQPSHTETCELWLLPFANPLLILATRILDSAYICAIMRTCPLCRQNSCRILPWSAMPQLSASADRVCDTVAGPSSLQLSGAKCRDLCFFSGWCAISLRCAVDLRMRKVMDIDIAIIDRIL